MQTIMSDAGVAVPAPPAVLAVSGESPARARAAATALSTHLCAQKAGSDLLLVVGETDAWLEAGATEVRVSFDSGTMRHRRKGGQNELLGRAVGVKADRKPRIWDATEFTAIRTPIGIIDADSVRGRLVASGWRTKRPMTSSEAAEAAAEASAPG